MSADVVRDGEIFRIATATADVISGMELALAKIDYDHRLAEIYTRHADKLQAAVDRADKLATVTTGGLVVPNDQGTDGRSCE